MGLNQTPFSPGYDGRAGPGREGRRLCDRDCTRPGSGSDGGVHLAARVANGRQSIQTTGNGDHVDQIILILDLRRLLAADHGDVRHAVVVFGTEVDITTHGVGALVVDAVFEGFHDRRGIESAGAL